MRKILILSLLLLAGACEQTPIPPKPSISFEGAPYILNVASIEVAQDYISSDQLPNVEKLSDIPPADAVKQWVAARLVAGGKQGHAEVNIKDASITKTELAKKKTGIEGYFTNEQTEEYTGTLEVDIKIYIEHRVLPIATVHVSSHASRTLPENATLIDHKNMYHDISVELMKSIEGPLDSNIREHFANYLM